MVELPCVIESLKSWNKKDWVKTADVCQMLLVLGEVKNEEEAKRFPRPAEVEPDSYRFPHGLTPPMHRVRKRRFRPRKSFMDVERIETNTESLLTEDSNAAQSKFELVDTDESEDAEGSSDDVEEEDEDAQGEDEEMMDAQNFGEEALDAGVNEADIMQAFMEEHGMDADNVQIEYENEVDNDDLFGEGGDGDNQGTVLEIEGVETPVTAHDVAKHALQNPNVVIETESAASTPAAATSNDDADDDDDDDDEEEEDEEAVQKAQQLEELKEQIQELNRAIQEQEQAREKTGNIMYKKRIGTRIEQLQRDVEVKQNQLQQLSGETED
jgi:transcription initiation factor TFIID subunit 7